MPVPRQLRKRNDKFTAAATGENVSTTRAVIPPESIAKSAANAKRNSPAATTAWYSSASKLLLAGALIMVLVGPILLQFLLAVGRAGSPAAEGAGAK